MVFLVISCHVHLSRYNWSHYNTDLTDASPSRIGLQVTPTSIKYTHTNSPSQISQRKKRERVASFTFSHTQRSGSTHQTLENPNLQFHQIQFFTELD